MEAKAYRTLTPIYNDRNPSGDATIPKEMVLFENDF